jgi:hypothetical protein
VSVTDKQIAEWERLAAEANNGPWQGVLLDFGALEGAAPDATEKERMKTYVAGSIDLGGDKFYAVLCEKPDGLADVCHTGNGPTSAANAMFLAAAREAVPALIAELAGWKKGVEDANRIAQERTARADALERELAAPMVVCPDCQIPVAVSEYPQHFRDHRAPARADRGADADTVSFLRRVAPAIPDALNRYRAALNRDDSTEVASARIAVEEAIRSALSSGEATALRAALRECTYLLKCAASGSPALDVPRAYAAVRDAQRALAASPSQPEKEEARRA